jgi:hypothetical protein
MAEFDAFSDIADSEILSATQLMELDIRAPCTSDKAFYRNPDFSDISDDELIQASDSVAVVDSGREQISRFRNPLCETDRSNIVGEKFAKKTVEKATWAVTLFGQWRANRNVRCISDESLVYLDKPFAVMNDEELHYCLPLFLTEILKKDGSEYPPGTLRDIILSLQKFMETNGRNVKFLSDDKFRNVRDTLDGLMKQRSRQGLGMIKKQAEVYMISYYIFNIHTFLSQPIYRIGTMFTV